MRILLLSAFPLLLTAQEQKKAGIETLLQQLGHMKEDTNKVNLLDEIIGYYVDNDNQKWLPFANQELALSEKIGWEKGQAMAYLRLGYACAYTIEYQKGLNFCRKAYDLAQKNKLTDLLYKILNVRGLFQFLVGNFDQSTKDLTSASAYFQHARSFENTSYPPSKAWETSATFVGIAYHYQKNDSAALHFYQQVLDKCIYEKDSLAIQTALGIFVEFFTYNIQNYPLALQYAFRQLTYFRPGDTSYKKASVHSRIGYIYGQQKKYVKALEYYRIATALKEDKNKDIKDEVKIGMSAIYKALGDYKNKLKLDLESLNEIEPGEYGEAYYNQAVGEDYIELRQYDQALFYLKKSWKIIQKTDDKFTKGTLITSLTRVYYLTKQYDLALATIKRNMENKKLHSYSRNQDYMYWGMIVRDAPDTVLRKHGIAPADRYRQAVKNIQIATAYFDSTKNLPGEHQLNCYKELSITYKMTKDYKGFFKAYPQYIALRDSSINRENQNDFLSRLSEVRFEKKVDSLRYQQHLTNEQLKLQTVSNRQERKYYISGLIALLLISFFIARNYYNQRRSNRLLTGANQQINAEKQRSDNLLLNILPADVAEELKENGTAGARLYDHVTVLFTDFVNFTTISELLTPQELVDELHTCFKAFDDIIGRYGIEKIKTIGDAYLAVAGLPNTDAQHAKNTVSAALEIRQFIHNRKQLMGNRTFDIRIGIHSGSVVAGIVGVKKFAYDIWGDTVNTAARMEQHSQPGQINLSEKTYELVRDEFAFTYRGEIEAKNKGALRMYFVEQPSVMMMPDLSE